MERQISKETIEEAFVNKDTGKLVSQRFHIPYLKKHGWYEPLLSFYPDSESIQETIYRILHDLSVRPVCKTCGGRLRFTNYSFPTFCCAHCRNIDPEVIEKNRRGVSIAQKETYKQRKDEILAKREKALSEKYDETIKSCSPFAYKQVQDKAKATILDHYGVDNVFYLDEFRSTQETWQQHSIQLWKERGYDISYLNDKENSILVKNGCQIHRDIVVPYNLFNNRMKEERRDKQVLCPICNPINNPETSIETVIKSMLDEIGVSYKQHDRQQIKPLELDFYIEDFKTAIECNGIYWHSGIENAFRQMQKYRACQDKGIKIIYLWEDQIIKKAEIIKSYLSSLFKKNARIWARKCEARLIQRAKAKEFLDENYLHNHNRIPNICYGLFYEDELVEVMTFKKHNNDSYEICQYCSKTFITIVGGFSKLLKHFEEDYKAIKIFSKCLNGLCFCEAFIKTKFNYVKDIGYNYEYVDKKLNRSNKEGIYKCYNCGYKYFEKIKG